MYVGDTAPPPDQAPGSRSPGRRLQGASPPLSTVPCPVYSVMNRYTSDRIHLPYYSLLKIKLHRQYSLDFATCIPSISGTRKDAQHPENIKYTANECWSLGEITRSRDSVPQHDLPPMCSSQPPAAIHIAV